MSKPAKIIIGLYGSKGVGKNFVADVIQGYVLIKGPELHLETQGYGVVKSPECYLESLAGPIKQFAIDALGIAPDSCYGSDKDKMALTDYDWDSMPFYHDKSGKMTVREVMQVVGTELGRETWGDKMWISALHSRIQRIFDETPDGPCVALVTDVRFDNEVVGIRDMGGLVWRVQGPQRIGETSKDDVHASERQRDDIECDATIVNEEGTTEDDILEQVAELLKDVDWFGTVEEPEEQTA